MHKDYFQRNIQLMSQLRSEHFKYSQYLQRGKYKLKQKFFGKGKKHYDFDINSQQYFHQQMNDITFDSSETQQCFFQMVNGAITQPLRVNNKRKFTEGVSRYSQSLLRNSIKAFPGQPEKILTYPLTIGNPAECRVMLAKHFYQRVEDLKYKKYLLQQRYHNLTVQSKHNTILPFIQSRITLIDKQLTSSLNRSTRLQHNDNFQQSFINNGKPIPVSQTGQPIYKYLDEEECWYSSIQRDDILVYTRNKEFMRDVLVGEYYQIEADVKAIVGRDGVEVYLEVENLVEKDRVYINQQVAHLAQNFNSLIQKQLQTISPGNLVEKQNLTNFGFTIFGILSNSPVTLPLYPAIYPEFFIAITQSTSVFFNNIKFTTQQQLIQVLPKLNSFCQILFKYQNKQILQGKKQIKLGLDDDIDLKKQLHTMLQQLWVKKYIKLSFERYDYKMQIKRVDWPLDSITDEIYRMDSSKQNYWMKMDTSTRELINLMTLDDVVTFRKHMKRRAEKILTRCQNKYLDMEQIIKYNKKSNQQMTIEQLSDLFRLKHSQQKQKLLKPASEMFLNIIMKKHWLVNAAEIEIQQTLRFLSIREDRIRIINILNGLSCYHRNLCMDLRVLTGQEFKFRLDDEFLINSTKQVVQNFQKNIKETATFATSLRENCTAEKANEEFLLEKQQYKREMLYKKDVVRVRFFGVEGAGDNYDNNGDITSSSSKIPHILVQSGTRRKSYIIYNSVLQHLLPQIQSRILKHASHLINNYQRYIKITQRQQIVDRVNLLQTLYSLQLKFLYQKFKLTEQYYYIYQNTTNILSAFKISQIITKLIYQQPKVDLDCCTKDGVTFQQLYRNNIDALTMECEFLEKFVERLKSQEQNQVESFHKMYAQAMKVPLTSQLYLYHDMEMKQKAKTRVQRLNSISTKLGNKPSKGTNSKPHQTHLIKQQIDEDSAQSSFDIQNYDQYLLKKDMDAIFDDMIQVDDNKDTTPINTTVQQNIVINPKFQGGPHPYNYYCDEVEITTERKEGIMNFYQTLAFAGNVRGMVEELREEFSSVYGHVSQAYQSYLSRVICKFMNGILLDPSRYISRWKVFQSSDSYHQIVTQSSRHYLQLMSTAIDPPSSIQMAISSTLQKHQQRLPGFNILSSLDYYSIQSLICLKKPVNIASYRQLALGINYLSFLNLRQSLFMIQLKRQRLIQAYQKLASNCGSSTDRYSSMYTRNGKGTIFLSAQQLKYFNQISYQYPVFPQVLSQLKSLLQCEYADIQLFQTIIKLAKIKIEDMIIMKHQVGRNFINSRFDNSRLLANDAKTVKMIRNRIAGEIMTVYNDQIKKNSFIKIKDSLKEKVDYFIKNLNQVDLIAKLTLPKEKISQYCKELLREKYKRKLIFEIIDRYSKDLIENSVKNRVFLQTDSVIKRLKKLVLCTPYMSRVLNLGIEGQRVNKKVFYDQKKTTRQQSSSFKPSFDNNTFTPANYIYSRQKLCDQWSQQEQLIRSNNLDQFKIHTLQLHPPIDKQQLFKWLYKIPHYSLLQHQQRALRHFIQSLGLPFTGKCSMSEFMEQQQLSQQLLSIQPPRNKFYTLYSHYSTLLQYIEINYLLVLLQAEDETFQSLRFLLENDRINFQMLFQLRDDVTVNQSLAEMERKYLKTCWNYKESRQDDKEVIKRKVEERGYSKAKEHWVVYDEIIDFVVGKIQGRGLIRENFLPFIKQLQSTLAVKDCPAIDLMRKRTQTVSHIFLLSTFQAYINQQHEPLSQHSHSSFSHYLFPLLKWFLNNHHQSYQLVSLSSNPRFGLNLKICNDHNQVQKFILGVFAENNSRMVKTCSIIQRYKAVMMINSVDVNAYVRNLLKSKMGNARQQNSLYLYDMNFLPYGMGLFELIGQQNRLKIFSRMRYFYQKVEDYMKIKPNVIKPEQVEDTKLAYVKFIFQSKIQSLAAVMFTAKPNFPISSKSFKEVSTTLKQQIQKATFTIFDKFEEYKMQNKIQFSKSQQKLMSIVQDVKKNQKLANIYNRLIRQVINSKLTRQEFKSRVLIESIKLLKNQRIQHVQPKKIINTSLIPRVHLIASYSSPLVLDRKTYISQQYKLAFAQAFINRFRNKVSRVDLLSSGYGFVITVPDLQDCVNFMNKLLFTFAQKEFRYRQETSQQYFEILMEAVSEKSRVITQQQEIIKYLTSKARNVMQAEYLGRVTDLLHQKTVIEDKLREVQQSTKGLEDRVRKAVQIQYQKKIASLESQNEILRNRFNEFKQLFVTLTKDAAKNNFLNVANTIRERIGDLLSKRIDVKEAFVGLERQQKREKEGRVVKEQLVNHHQDKNAKKQQQSQTYTTRDLQRCALGEDIIHDPYYTTKLIQKMRLFNIFKLGAKRIHFQQVEQRKTLELKALHKIQDTVIVQSEREILVREELKRTQEELSKKTSQLQKIKQSYQMLDNQRTKLKILLAGKDKKIEQKQREAQENIKRIQQIEKLPSLSQSQSKIDRVQEQKTVPKLSEFRKLHNKKSSRIQKSPFVTSIPYEPSVSIYDRFELSNKDATWRQKCEQLYIENKKLLNELEKAHSALTTPTREGHSLSLRQRNISQSFVNDQNGNRKEEQLQSRKDKRFPNIGFKYNLMKQSLGSFGQ